MLLPPPPPPLLSTVLLVLLAVCTSAQPTTISLTFELLSIDEISPTTSSFDVSFFLVAKWVDPSPLVLPNCTNSLQPSIYVTDLAHVPHTDSGGWTMCQATGQQVTMSMLVHARASHSFGMRTFPFDQHNLTLSFETLNYPSQFVTLVPTTAYLGPITRCCNEWQVQPLILMDGPMTSPYISLPRTWSRAVFTLQVTREPDFWIAQAFFPAILAVLVAWGTMWLPLQAYTARVLTTALSATTVFAIRASVTPRLPIVSYSTYLDIFLLLSWALCFVGVFLQLHIAHWGYRGNLRGQEFAGLVGRVVMGVLSWILALLLLLVATPLWSFITFTIVCLILTVVLLRGSLMKMQRVFDGGGRAALLPPEATDDHLLPQHTFAKPFAPTMMINNTVPSSLGDGGGRGGGGGSGSTGGSGGGSGGGAFVVLREDFGNNYNNNNKGAAGDEPAPYRLRTALHQQEWKTEWTEPGVC